MTTSQSHNTSAHKLTGEGDDDQDHQKKHEKDDDKGYSNRKVERASLQTPPQTVHLSILGTTKRRKRHPIMRRYLTLIIFLEACMYSMRIIVISAGSIVLDAFPLAHFIPRNILVQASLVPMPSAPPVFDRLQQAIRCRRFGNEAKFRLHEGTLHLRYAGEEKRTSGHYSQGSVARRNSKV